jgi:hypothetical protein
MRSNHTYLPALAIVQIQDKNSMIFIIAASHYYINDLKKNHLRKNNSDYKNLKLPERCVRSCACATRFKYTKLALGTSGRTLMSNVWRVHTSKDNLLRSNLNEQNFILGVNVERQNVLIKYIISFFSTWQISTHRSTTEPWCTSMVFTASKLFLSLNFIIA